MAGKKPIYTKLINSLVSSGVWGKLDALYIFAAPNTSTALTNLISASHKATNHGAAFTVDRGFKGDGASAWIDTNYDLATMGPRYKREDASCFVWCLSAGESSAPAVGSGSTYYTDLFPLYNGGLWFVSINDHNDGTLGNPIPSGKIFLSGDRDVYNEVHDGFPPPLPWIVAYINGVEVLNDIGNPAYDPPAEHLTVLKGRDGFCSQQVAVVGCGGKLGAGGHRALYTALKTYLRAVGAV